MKVLVTGIAGFLGRHVATELDRAGHAVMGFDLRANTLWPTRVGDLADLDALEAAVAEVDCVCHLAGVGDVYRAMEHPTEAAMANVVGTANVAEAARRHQPCRVVYASTWEVYGTPRYEPMDEDHPCDPDHFYNITKLAGERLLIAYGRLNGVPAVALRLGTAFGPGMRPNSVFSRFIDRARAGEPIVIDGTGEQSRQFTHTRDIARAFRLAAESDLTGVVMNAVSPERVTICALAEAVVARLPVAVEHRPPRAGDVPSAVVSSARAREMLGWEAQVSFATGLDEMIGLASAPGRPGARSDATERTTASPAMPSKVHDASPARQ